MKKIFNEKEVENLKKNNFRFSANAELLFKYYYGKEYETGIQKGVDDSSTCGFVIIGNNERLFITTNNPLLNN